MDDEDVQRLRPLGTFERFRAVLHDLGFHYNVALAARYAHQFQDIDINRLYRALRDVITQLPALSVTIRGSGSDAPYFARLPSVDLSHVVRWVATHHSDTGRISLLNDILSKENSKGFDLKTLDPLWRIVAFKTSDPTSMGKDQNPQETAIIFVWHHAIGDGHSGIAVLHAVLDALDSTMSQEKGGPTDADIPSNQHVTFVPSPTQKLTPALESLLPMQSSLRTKIKCASLTNVDNCPENIMPKRWSGEIIRTCLPSRH